MTADEVYLMTVETVVFGNIIDDQQRRQLEESGSELSIAYKWRDSPSLESVTHNSTIVIVDLDDPRFASAEFLVSLATAGEKIRLIGKVDNPDLESTKRFARMGVSEVLTSKECLVRLQSMLDEIEKVVEDDEAGSSNYSTHALIGTSSQTNEIREMIKTLSEVDFPSALLLGETGTGKSLVSKILHHYGLRSKHNFVEVNCSAIQDELFESELFGHVKGAFTDAKNDKTGLFEFAQDGTLFLDEVGNLSPSAQGKLLKILDDKKLRRVGAVEDKDINVRVIAATNIDLEDAVKKGIFREDLFFRLNLLTITIPPVRERREDIPDLIDYYMGYFCTNYCKPDLTISKEVMEVLVQHSWPGNIRELCNVVERAVLLTKNSRIGLRDINIAVKDSRISPADRRKMSIDLPPQGISLREIEHNVIKQVLNMFDWNKSEAARYLSISRARLRRMIEAAGLEQNRRQT